MESKFKFRLFFGVNLIYVFLNNINYILLGELFFMREENYIWKHIEIILLWICTYKKIIYNFFFLNYFSNLDALGYILIALSLSLSLYYNWMMDGSPLISWVISIYLKCICFKYLHFRFHTNSFRWIFYYNHLFQFKSQSIDVILF